MQLNSGCILVDLLMESDEEKFQEELVCQGKVKSSLWDMIQVQLLIVGYTGLNIRGGIRIRRVQVLRVVSCTVLGTIRLNEISLGVSAG